MRDKTVTSKNGAWQHRPVRKVTRKLAHGVKHHNTVVVKTRREQARVAEFTLTRIVGELERSLRNRFDTEPFGATRKSRQQQLILRRGTNQRQRTSPFTSRQRLRQSIGLHGMAGQGMEQVRCALRSAQSIFRRGSIDQEDSLSARRRSNLRHRSSGKFPARYAGYPV